MDGWLNKTSDFNTGVYFPFQSTMHANNPSLTLSFILSLMELFFCLIPTKPKPHCSHIIKQIHISTVLYVVLEVVVEHHILPFNFKALLNEQHICLMSS